MSKALPKVTVHCPHCGAEQQEPPLAKSTFCRKCSEYFAITPATLGHAPPVTPKQRPSTSTNSWSRPASTTLAASAPAPMAPFRGRSAAASPPPPRPEEGEQGIRGKIEGIFSGKSKLQVAQCFECNSWHEVSSTAQSSTCKACGAYIDLQDYKVNGSFSRNIKTRGSVYLGSKGDLSSSKIVCSQAVIHGKMRGNLTCEGKVTIRVQGKLFGSVEAGELVVEKGSEVVFSRPIHASTAEIHGRMSGDVVAEGLVTIFKHGLLDGAVSASGFVVERGGCFQGELTISPRQRAAATRDDEAQATSTDPGVPASNPTFLAGGEESPALA